MNISLSNCGLLDDSLIYATILQTGGQYNIMTKINPKQNQKKKKNKKNKNNELTGEMAKLGTKIAKA